MQVFVKKMQKNLVMSIFCSTFAPAFVRGASFALSGGGRFSRLTGTPPGAIAQLVEQRTENPCVPSSILGGTTKNDLIRVVFWCPSTRIKLEFSAASLCRLLQSNSLISAISDSRWHHEKRPDEGRFLVL